MYAFITILIVVVCALLGVVVLIQNPKGGGLNATFGGVGQQLLGARKSTDVIEKLTWGFAVALIVLCLSTSFFAKKGGVVKKDQQEKSIIEQQQMKTPANSFAQPTQTPAQPNAPTQAQGQQPTAPSGN